MINHLTNHKQRAKIIPSRLSCDVAKQNHSPCDCRKIEKKDSPVITSWPVSTTLVLKWIRCPFCHISTFNVWPGITGLVNRTLIALNKDESFPAYVWRTALAEKPDDIYGCDGTIGSKMELNFKNLPKVQRPWRIGTGWPPSKAKSGSIWSGLKSPDNLKIFVDYELFCTSLWALRHWREPFLSLSFVVIFHKGLLIEKH